MKTDVLVKEAMKYKPVMVQPTITVLEATQLMKAKKIGNILIGEKKQLIGILTESDIVKKIVAEGKNARDMLVKDVMSTPVIVIDPYKTIEEAMKIMSKSNIRRLPVIENGELVGIITQKDILLISPILLEMYKEWGDITKKDEAYLQNQIFSGKCEDCGTLSSGLKSIDGRLLCEDCIDELKFE